MNKKRYLEEVFNFFLHTSIGMMLIMGSLKYIYAAYVIDTLDIIFFITALLTGFLCIQSSGVYLYKLEKLEKRCKE